MCRELVSGADFKAILRANRLAAVFAKYKIGKESGAQGVRSQASTTTKKKFGAYASDTCEKLTE